jgi:hypothetical protein
LTRRRRRCHRPTSGPARRKLRPACGAVCADCDAPGSRRWFRLNPARHGFGNHPIRARRQRVAGGGETMSTTTAHPARRLTYDDFARFPDDGLGHEIPRRRQSPSTVRNRLEASARLKPSIGHGSSRPRSSAASRWRSRSCSRDRSGARSGHRPYLVLVPPNRSPSVLIAATVTKMNIPGKIASHGSVLIADCAW